MKRRLLFLLSALSVTAALLLSQFENPACIEEVESRFVSGGSLEGVVPENSRVEILQGYYQCNQLKRGDLVVFHAFQQQSSTPLANTNQVSSPSSPLIKIAYGVPGDRFALEQDQDHWKIRINGETLRTSRGEPFRLSDARAAILLKEQEKSNGIIPRGYCLVFGNLAQGSLDSTRFGFVPARQLIGKALCPDCI